MTVTRRELLAVALSGLDRPVRIGIWGTIGHNAEVFDALPALPGARIAAWAETDPNLARGFARNKNVAAAKAYTDPRRMLDSEKLEIAVIANDNGARAEAILECAARRLHVFSEKPLALTEAGLKAVEDSIRKHGVRLGCMLGMRTDPWYQAMRQFVREGVIGEVAQVESQKSYKTDDWPAWKSRYATYGGTIPWIGIHMIDLMRATTGREFTSVVSHQAHIGFPELGEMENTTGSLFRMDNGGIAVMRLDYLRTNEAPTHGDDRLRIAGTKGIVEYQLSTGLTLQERGKAPRTVTALPERRWLFADFVNAIYAGGKDELMEEDIYRSMRSTLRAWESAKSGQPVAI